MSELALQVESLGKSFRVGFFMKRIDAVHEVSFEVPLGASVGLVGPNGAGKTTTLKMALGLIFPTRGQAKLFGHAAGDPEGFRRVGYMPENPYLYQFLKPLEFLMLCGQLSGLPRKQRRERAMHWLERVGLAHAADRPIARFSKGMMQRVGLAQAMLHDPELIILDEPMSGLDPVGRLQVRELLLEQRKLGKTLLVTSHILHDVEALCDRIVMIHHGRVAMTGSMSELCRETGAVEVVLERSSEAVQAHCAQHGFETELHGERLVAQVPDWEAVHALSKVAASAGVRMLRAEMAQDNLEALFMRLSEQDAAKASTAD